MKNFKSFVPELCEKTVEGLLSNREKEILNFIINGYTNSEIARALHLSCRTVDTHRQNLLAKLGARNTAVLVRLGVENIHCLKSVV